MWYGRWQETRNKLVMTLATHISGITKIMKYIKYKIIKKTLYVKALQKKFKTLL